MRNPMLLISLSVVMVVGCVREVCDSDKRDRLFMECLERTPKNVVNAGEDVSLGSAVWPCQFMAEKFACWKEPVKLWGK